MKFKLEANSLADKEVELILANALELLADPGMVVENEELLDLLASHGAQVDKTKEIARFPVNLTERLIAESSEEYDAIEGLEVSCLLPYGKRREYSHGLEITAGTYPQFYHTPDGEIVQHTAATVAEITRLADYLPNIDRLGAMGIPSDLPAEMGPLYMRLIGWKNAQRKLSGCGEVRNPALIPYLVEMGEIIADYKKAPVRRYTFAEVELIAPLKFTRAEASIFTDYWKRGLLAGIGTMHSAGGSAPATLAGTVSLDVAESLFISFLYRFCYGMKKLWLQSNSSILDMQRGMFPFGRPERGLIALAVGQTARAIKAGLWASSIYADAKTPGIEAGMQASFNAIPVIMAGSLGLECFGILSGAEMNSAVQLVIDNEYGAGLKRFARGFEVNEDTLALDVIREVGPGGFFGGTDHTVAHYRTEHWQPEIFSREGLNSWMASGKKTELDRAAEIVRTILKEYHPSGMDETTEKRLLAVIERCRKDVLS